MEQGGGGQLAVETRYTRVPLPVTYATSRKFCPGYTVGKNKKNLEILFLKSVKFRNFCTGYSLNPRKSVNPSYFSRFLVIFNETFAPVMGLP